MEEEAERKVKRLRGWKLEQAKLEGSPCEKDAENHSALCARLLELWSQGKLSACQVAELSHLAVLDGCASQELVSLAKCGNWGNSKANAHRDLVALHCSSMQLCEPTPVQVTFFDSKTQTPCEQDASLLLPHLLFASLEQHYGDHFEEFFACSSCESFWTGVEKTKDERLTWPVALDKRVVCPKQTVPIFVHGDGVEFQTRDSLMTWSWGPMLSKQSSLSSHLLLAALPKSCTLPKTWEPLCEWIRWSFEALSKGCHPSEDPWGNPLPKGLAELAGLPLTKGHHRAVIWSIQGDAEFFANVLKLPHWQNKHPCHECDCQKPVYKKKCPAGKSAKILKEAEQSFVPVTPAQALLAKRSSHPLFSIEGVSTALVRGDSLHILFSRGVGSHLAGSLLHFLCYFDGARRQAVPPAQRLQLMFSRIKELYCKDGKSRLTNLRLSMFSDTKKPHQKFPCLEAKAAETKHILPCLLQVLKEALPGDQPIHQTMIDCLGSFNQLVQHFDSIDLFPTSEEFALAKNLAKRFFDSYQDLNSWALSKGKKLFNITHKFHTMMHLIENSQFLNYRIHHNYRAEDYVGKLSTLAHSVSFGVKAVRLSAKVAAKYRILLHLQLTRPGFGFVDEAPDNLC